MPLAIVYVAAFYLVLGSPDFYSFTAGFLGGYLFYDMTHYYVHHRRPKTALGNAARELHMRHHFQDPDTSFGISAPYWDKVFGTAPSERPYEDRSSPPRALTPARHCPDLWRGGRVAEGTRLLSE